MAASLVKWLIESHELWNVGFFKACIWVGEMGSGCDHSEVFFSGVICLEVFSLNFLFSAETVECFGSLSVEDTGGHLPDIGAAVIWLALGFVVEIPVRSFELSF